MPRRTFFIILLLVFAAGGASAQRAAGKAVASRLSRQGVAAGTAGSSAARKTAGAVARGEALEHTLQSRAARQQKAASSAAAKNRSSIGEAARRRAASNLSREEMEKRVAALLRENADIEAKIAQMEKEEGLLRSTFRAVGENSSDASVFSGTVFKTVYQGQEEIFGVVAAHPISPDAFHTKDSLKKKFFMIVYHNGEHRRLPVEIVQISARSMLDLALVKFRPEDEKFFRPLTIGRVENLSEPLYSYGYAMGLGTDVERNILGNSLVSFRTTIPIRRNDRFGFCGSPVVNAKHELVGIHTGSVYQKAGEAEDVGYATSAEFLDVLVKAYHNGGKALFPLKIEGHTMAEMNVDEYVAAMTLYDANMKQLWQQGFENKFAQSKLTKALREHPQARYVMTTTRRTYWEGDDVLVENRAKWDKTKKQYKYDLQERRIVSVK